MKDENGDAELRKSPEGFREPRPSALAEESSKPKTTVPDWTPVVKIALAILAVGIAATLLLSSIASTAAPSFGVFDKRMGVVAIVGVGVAAALLLSLTPRGFASLVERIGLVVSGVGVAAVLFLMVMPSILRSQLFPIREPEEQLVGGGWGVLLCLAAGLGLLGLVLLALGALWVALHDLRRPGSAGRDSVDSELSLYSRCRCCLSAWLLAAVGGIIVDLGLLFHPFAFLRPLVTRVMPIGSLGIATYYVAISTAWLLHVGLTVWALRQHRRRSFFALYGILCTLLFCNVVGWFLLAWR